MSNGWTDGDQRANIEDVARLAGVSLATVSRALRGLPNVAEATRAAVQAAADELHYRPDPAAAQLASGRSNLVAVVVPILGGWYFAQVIRGVDAALTGSGLDLMVLGIADSDERARLLSGSHSIARRADAIILVDVAIGEDGQAALARLGLRVVAIGVGAPGALCVRIDDTEVGRLATSHLLELGHRRIGLIRGQDAYDLGFVPPILRRDGYVSALAEYGVALDADLELSGDFSIEGGRDAMLRLMSAADRPTGVFAMSDEMAFGAFKAAAELGLRVPDDVSIVGVDDHEFAEVVGLTTVRQAVIEHGARAAQFVIDLLAGRPVPGSADEPVSLVVRTSTGAPPAVVAIADSQAPPR
jgi:LacI family transcriptional regulator, repressor for deo operon, udp, cdd, tsx, nupC, and nupG